jgi:hypothetical protein
MLDWLEKVGTFADFSEIVGVFFFLAVMVAVSVIKKLSEKAAQTEERRKSETLTKADEMPENTRRMIYGDDIPVAKPRQPQSMGQRTAVPPPVPVAQQRAQPQAQPASGRPIELTDLLESLTGVKVQMERSETVEPGGKRVLVEEKRVVTHQPRPQAEGRLRREDVPSKPQAPRPTAPARQQQPKPVQRRPQVVAKTAIHGNVIEEERLRLMQNRDRGGSGAAQTWVAKALHRPENARKAIVLLEVLGPPRALREYQPIGQL